jgi:hypothetical protein
MSNLMKVISTPRIQVVLTLAEGAKTFPDGSTRGPFDAWLVLDLPDGEDPTTIRLDGSPFDQDAAIFLIDAVYTHISEKFAKPEASGGALVLGRNRQ